MRKVNKNQAMIENMLAKMTRLGFNKSKKEMPEDLPGWLSRLDVTVMNKEGLGDVELSELESLTRKVAELELRVQGVKRVEELNDRVKKLEHNMDWEQFASTAIRSMVGKWLRLTVERRQNEAEEEDPTNAVIQGILQDASQDQLG